MSTHSVILTRTQWIGIAIILTLLMVVFVGLHLLPSPQSPPAVTNADTIQNTIINRKKQYYDSLHHVRQLYYDSLRTVRRDSLHHVYTAHRDSIRHADSLWWDSVYQATPRTIKKDTVLSLNTADTNALKLIRGIGSGMARRIVRYRDELGGFVSVEQLQDDQLYQDQYGHSMKSKYSLPDSVLSHFIILADTIRQIPVNHASIERLQAHPYISHTLAKEIYTLRRKHIRLKNIDEIRCLPHANDSVLSRIAPYLNFEN